MSDLVPSPLPLVALVYFAPIPPGTGCDEPLDVEGEFVSAFGGQYHHDCLKCTTCHEILGRGDVTHYEGNDDGKPYCAPCYRCVLRNEVHHAFDARSHPRSLHAAPNPRLSLPPLLTISSLAAV